MLSFTCSSCWRNMAGATFGEAKASHACQVEASKRRHPSTKRAPWMSANVARDNEEAVIPLFAPGKMEPF